MKPLLLSLFTCASLLLGCTEEPGIAASPHREGNAMYYWRTLFDPDAAELAFLTTHQIDRIYLRFFDVVANRGAGSDEEVVIPNATVRFPRNWSSQQRETYNDKEFVPVVYLTLDALKCIKGNEDRWGAEVVTRVQHMCSYHQLPSVHELQLDCDWTPSTEASFFALCRSVQSQIAQCKLPWRVSSTIRLHQLARPVPPVDCGVLMVYNTGNFNDPDAHNSILDEKDVTPYLKHLATYPLHLDVAYPTYSWQLLFRERQFTGLLQGVDVTDTTRFVPRGKNTYVAKCDLPFNRRVIRKNDRLRVERSDYAAIARIKEQIEQKLAHRPHSILLYHLDSRNLSHYTTDEIQTLFATHSK